MKRFHVHLHVDDLNRSIGFYSQLFAAQPARDLRSGEGFSGTVYKKGEPHLVADLTKHMELLDEGMTTCCYARSEKHWVTDPQGIAWEHFHTLGSIPVFHEAASVTTPITAPACCTASPRSSCC